MQIVPFEDKHIISWQKAIDRTFMSPGPTSGPEYASSMDIAWKKTYICELDDLFLPFTIRSSNQFKVLPSKNYVGAQINSFLGLRSIESSVFDRLALLPRDCVITLQLPWEIFDQHQREFRLLKYDYQSTFDYHMIPLRDSYDEWFNRKVIERRFIRKAERESVVVRIGGEELLEPFYNVYQCSVRRWQSKDPRSHFHRLDRMQRLFTYPGTRAQVALGYYNETPIAGAVFAAYEKTAAYLFGGFDYEYQNLRAMFLVHATIVRKLIESNISLYSHGLSLGRKTLEHFKESLGAERRHAVVVVRHRFPRLKRMIKGTQSLPDFSNPQVSAQSGALHEI